MMTEEAVAQEAVLDEKDITALVEDVDKDLEEVAETAGLMS